MAVLQIFFRPFKARSFPALLPGACARGCILASLRDFALHLAVYVFQEIYRRDGQEFVNGSSTVMRVPFPGALSAEMVPP
jgi:hypothetical protein